MDGVMQNPKEKSDKSNPGRGWSVPAIICAVLAAAAVMGICGFAPLWFPEKWGWGKDEMSILERMKFAAYVVGGGLVMWQLQISNRRSTALEKTAALGEKGNITERFKNAIEHLGSDSESIRMGGIYGLYHVARESSEYADTVLKILCAHAKLIMAKPGYAEKNPLPNEIATILDVLFPVTSNENQNVEILFKKVNASNWDLHCADVSSRNMKHIDGVGVNLSQAKLSNANLSSAYLPKINLLKAFLMEANLSRAFMPQANLEETNLSGANLSGTNLRAASLFGATLSAANLSEANLYDAHLPMAVLVGANLHRANLSAASMIKANLSRTNLDGANMSATLMSEAKVTAEQLLETQTLYGATLDDHIHKEILRRKPELLDDPAKKK